MGWVYSGVVRTRLLAVPGPTGLACPYCGRFAGKGSVTSALRQLSNHAAKVHRLEYGRERWCNGPSHRLAPVLLPISAFNRRGRPYDGRRHCKVCEAFDRNGPNSGWVPAEAVRPYVVRLHERFGSGAHPAIPVSSGCFYNILRGRTRFVHRRIAARLMLAAGALEPSLLGVQEATSSSCCSVPSCPEEARHGSFCSYHRRGG
jgi:hypothetical protein